jgi:hypothetical protein
MLLYNYGFILDDARIIGWDAPEVQTMIKIFASIR